MLEKILSELNKRGVYVDVKTRYSARTEQLHHTAEVNTGHWSHPPSVPTFAFKVYGNSFDELAKKIEERLPMVEPIIAAMEKANRPTVEPNLDSKTARERPIA